MKKNFVIDTNILIHNPNCLTTFEENNIYIPYPVVEELDGKKKAPGEAGFSAREAARNLVALRKYGNLQNGVKTQGGGMLYLYVSENFDTGKLPKGWNPDKMDNLILLSAMEIAGKKNDVFLVTNDLNMTLKADMLGIQVQEYKNDRIADIDTLYTGRSIRHMTGYDFENFVSQGAAPVSVLADEGLPELVANEFVTIKSWTGSSRLAKYNGDILIPLKHQAVMPCGLKTRNAGQVFMKEALMSSYEEKPLSICIGTAGTGKTLFAIACGLEQVLEQKKYQNVLVCRSNIMMDEEIGYLPGTEKEKISPLLRGVYDNLKIIFGNEEDTKEAMDDKIQELFARGYIEAQAISYLRGRSIRNTYVIIDEAQNCTPNQIFSIITRAGEGSKFVLIGDPNQIDNPRLDTRNNGLVFALDRMKGDSLCDIVSFDATECTRSSLAKTASDKLKNK